MTCGARAHAKMSRIEIGGSGKPSSLATAIFEMVSKLHHRVLTLCHPTQRPATDRVDPPPRRSRGSAGAPSKNCTSRHAAGVKKRQALSSQQLLRTQCKARRHTRNPLSRRTDRPRDDQRPRAPAGEHSPRRMRAHLPSNSSTSRVWYRPLRPVRRQIMLPFTAAVSTPTPFKIGLRARQEPVDIDVSVQRVGSLKTPHWHWARVVSSSSSWHEHLNPC